MNYSTGMSAYAFAFLLGVVLLQQFSVLPGLLPLILLLGCVFFAFLYRHFFLLAQHNAGQYQRESTSYITLIYLFILLIINGFIYANLYATLHLSHRLDESFVGRNILISGQVTGLPVNSEDSQRFEFVVESFHMPGQEPPDASALPNKLPEKLRLSWYYGSRVNAGETWQLEVRLKPPHGFMNPGGFDYEGWLFQQGIDATGYVRQSESNRLLQAATGFSIANIRQSLSRQIDAVSYRQQHSGDRIMNPGMALVKALAIGDKSSLSVKQWRILSNTGTSHLMAISGLHVGLAALFGYMLIRRVLPVFIMKRLPAQQVAQAGGMVLALSYALVAGLSIPTQRAIIMLFTLYLMLLIRRNSRPVDVLGLAMFVVLLVDPAAVLSAGFWFSFSAVAVIYVSVMNSGDTMLSGINSPILHRLATILRQWLRLQLMISLFLLPLSLFMFQQGSLISPLANLLLIPYVSFLVVPVVLLAIACSFLFQGMADQLFELAAFLLNIIWPLLSYLADQPYAMWVNGNIDIVELLLASSAMLLLYFAEDIARFFAVRFVWANTQTNLMAVYWPLRLLACLLFIPLFITHAPLLKAGDYQVTILDVGQGSAAVIKTQNHAVVFDSGARFSDRMEAGSSVLIPYLRSQGIQKLDRLIISHGDMDHIGGAQTILDSFPEADLIGQDIDDLVFRGSGSDSRTPCYAGMSWQWDGVNFAFISPEKTAVMSPNTDKRNNHSCVLRVVSASGAVLFTGDIEKSVEDRLLQQYPDGLMADILIVPHHGSNTSSSQAFIQAVKPKISLISVGYKNRYRLPSRLVTSRYAQLDSEVIETDKSGAVTIKLLAATGISVERYRQTAGKYWHHRLP